MKPAMKAEDIRKRLLDLEDKEKAKTLQRFFKTGPGEYGEGDIFLGVMVPQLRKLSKEYGELDLGEVEGLLKSSVHEERLLALLILIHKYNRGDKAEKKKIYGLYLKSTRWINNWDLVDLSAPNIVGDFLMKRSREPLGNVELRSSRPFSSSRVTNSMKHSESARSSSLIKKTSFTNLSVGCSGRLEKGTRPLRKAS
jgi:hypothetical protein